MAGKQFWRLFIVSAALTIMICGVVGVVALRPLTARASGTFSVSGTQILDPNGNQFLIKGVNINGPNWVWPIEMTQYADLIGSSAWQFNLVRVNSDLKGNNYHDNDNTDTIVNAFTSRHIVVMFEAHDWTGSYPTGSDLTLAENWYQNLANKYKNNTYVWFDTFNEPGDCSNPVSSNWLTAQQGIVSAIRDGAGANNVITVEDNGWAQGLACTGSDAILSQGAQVLHFNNKNYSNITFNTHIYCGWNNNQSGLNSYFDQVAAKNYAIFVGEFGVFGGNNCDATSSVQEMYNYLANHVIGRVVWHWYGGDGNNLTNTPNPSGGWKINSTTNPTNLTWLGQQVWNDTHSSAPTPTPSPTPTSNKYEAENASLAGGAQVNTNHSGYSGSGFVDGYWNVGATTTFTVNFSSAGNYNVDLRYGNGMGNTRTLDIYVNGSLSKTTSLANLGGWDTWGDQTESLSLNSGNNTIAYKYDSSNNGNVNLDYIKLSGPTGGSVLNRSGWIASASSSDSGDGWVPSNAIDGNASTLWSSGHPQTNGDWFQVDMQSAKSFSKVVLDTTGDNTDYPRGYAVYVSNDGSSWGSAIATGTGSIVTTITFSTQNARYIRIVQTGSDSTYWWSIHELNVYS